MRRGHTGLTWSKARQSRIIEFAPFHKIFRPTSNVGGWKMFQPKSTLSSQMHIKELKVGAFSTLTFSPGLVEEEITCGDAFVTFRTFAHASLDRLMVAEVHVERTGEEDSSDEVVVVTRIDLSGEEDGGDFLWEDSVEESGAW